MEIGLGDNTPRLVFADYLDEKGFHDRAEFIRLHIEFTKMTPSDPDYKVTRKRLIELLIVNFKKWVSREAQAVVRTQEKRDVYEYFFSVLFYDNRSYSDFKLALDSFKNGFLSSLVLSEPNFSNIELIAKANILHLDMAAVVSPATLATLAAESSAKFIQKLILSYESLTIDSGFTAKTIPAIAANENFSGLLELDATEYSDTLETTHISFWPLLSEEASTKGLKSILWSHLQPIEKFTGLLPLSKLALKNLTSVMGSDNDARQILGSGIYNELESLSISPQHSSLSISGITNAGLREILLNAPRLLKLKVISSDLNDNVAEVFGGLAHPLVVEEIELISDQFTATVVENLLRTTMDMSQLTTLTIGPTHFYSSTRRAGLHYTGTPGLLKSWKEKVPNRKLILDTHQI